jgi:hypothetical protein
LKQKNGVQTPKEKSWLAASRTDGSNKAKNARITAMEGVGRGKINETTRRAARFIKPASGFWPVKVTAKGNIDQGAAQ